MTKPYTSRTAFLSQRKFSEGMPCIGGLTFNEVWVTQPEFVYNAMLWDSATGNLGLFKEYCDLRKDDFPKEYEPPILRAWKTKKHGK